MDTELQAHYLEAWQNLLGHGLGWTPDEVIEWANQEFFNIGPSSIPWVFHESPTYWVAHLFIPNRLKERLDTQAQSQLRYRIIEGLDVCGTSCLFNPGPDLQGAMSRVKAVLGDFENDPR